MSQPWLMPSCARAQRMRTAARKRRTEAAPPQSARPRTLAAACPPLRNSKWRSRQRERPPAPSAGGASCWADHCRIMSSNGGCLQAPPSLAGCEGPCAISWVSPRASACFRNHIAALRSMRYVSYLCHACVAGYTMSGGIACNKLLAKIASAMHKPNQQTIIPPRQVPSIQVCYRDCMQHAARAG